MTHAIPGQRSGELGALAQHLEQVHEQQELGVAERAVVVYVAQRVDLLQGHPDLCPGVQLPSLGKPHAAALLPSKLPDHQPVKV